jgi:AcrR family transcriptional regulator
MTVAHRRKKNPEQVRQTLLESAISLAVSGGLNAVSIQSVAQATGVTKGGLFHHFQNKQALLDAVFDWFLAQFDQALDALIEADRTDAGCFTRAYVRTLFNETDTRPDDTLGPLWISSLTDPDMKAKWACWFEARVDKHWETDSGPVLESVRFTVDGLWLAELAGVSVRNRDALRDLLIASTYPS